MSRIVPPVKPYFPDEDIERVKSDVERILRSGMLTLHTYTREFERRFAELCGVKYAIAVNSGTSALEISLRAFNLKGGDAVIVPTNTFSATAAAVFFAGGRPVLTDIDPNSLCISADEVQEHITSKTRGVIVVHIGGLVCPEIREIREICEDEGLFLIEDAAHAHGSMFDGECAGSFGDCGCFSFYPTKVITTGEGGMITTNDDEIAEKARLIRDQGKVKGNLIGAMGYNWRMTEFQAIVGLAQLRMLEEMIAGRRRVARLYDELVADIPILEPLVVPENVRHNYYKYILFLPKGRDPMELKQHMKSKYNVSLAGFVYEVPLHRQPVFKEYVDDPNSYPVADDLCYRHIALPIYPQMTEEEAQYVVDSLKSSLRELGWMG